MAGKSPPLDHGAEIALHGGPFASANLSDRQVNVFCYIKQTVFILNGQLYGGHSPLLCNVISTDAQLPQRILNDLGMIHHVFSLMVVIGRFYDKNRRDSGLSIKFACFRHKKQLEGHENGSSDDSIRFNISLTAKNVWSCHKKTDAFL